MIYTQKKSHHILNIFALLALGSTALRWIINTYNLYRWVLPWYAIAGRIKSCRWPHFPYPWPKRSSYTILHFMRIAPHTIHNVALDYYIIIFSSSVTGFISSISNNTWPQLFLISFSYTNLNADRLIEIEYWYSKI